MGEAAGSATVDGTGRADEGIAATFAGRLEVALRGLLELSVGVLSAMEENVSPSHLRALQSLDHLGGAKVTALGDALGVPPSTASRISDRLTAAGLITREVAPDNRRATWLDLTSAGRAVLSDLADARAQALERVTEAMTPAERDALLLGAEGFARAYESVIARADEDPEDAGR
ncbi:MarR family transcriptional regulator [Actinomycetospora chibensis]|uniref:MarR family transcriptional regulator n=1 Tax=Actinomycetospora chibensis TaxID=663606 RepID=A0ABV9RNN3_9PSEU|nr:MarR family transcriptional regulator [Actinomycetospora chibensis]MDD7923256.1 MarR family transcriptional regulator [Actinomycetospora chibensis]